MSNMKLIFLFFLIVISLENCDYYHYFDNDNNIKCTFNYSCPEEFNKLIPNKKECVKDCKKDPIYKYEYKYECLEKCPSPETELINETFCSEISTKEKPYQIKTLTKRKNEEDTKSCALTLKEYYNLSNNGEIDIRINSDNKYEAYYYINSTEKIKLNISLCGSEYEIINDDFTPNNSNAIDKCNIGYPFLHNITKECVEKCAKNDLLNEKCILSYVINDNEDEMSPEKYDEFQKMVLNYVENIITSEEYYQYLINNDFNLVSGNMMIYFEKLNAEPELLTKFPYKTTIELGDCQEKLKIYYDIDYIYVKQIQAFEQGLYIYRVEYDLYGEVNNSKHFVQLDKSLCANKNITLYIPISDYDSIVNYNIITEFSEDPYCSLLESNNIIKVDYSQNIINNYFDSNKYSCGDRCTYVNYSSYAGKVQCNCEIRETLPINFKLYKEYKEKIDKNDEYLQFETETRSLFNLRVLSCNVLSDFKNLQSNIGFYVLAIIIFVFIINMIIFCIKGFTLFNNKMIGIIKKNFDNNGRAIVNPPKKNGDILHIIGKKSKTHRRGRKRGKKKDKSLKVKNETTNDFLNKKQKNIATSGNISNNLNNINNNILPPGNKYIYYPETDYELNWLSFDDAVKYDKRQCCDYYCSLIKTKQILLFSFCSLNDYNSNIIKKSFIFLSFAYHYAFSALFYCDLSIIREYDNLNIMNHIPSIFYASIFSTYILRILILNLALNDKDAYMIKIQTDKNTAMRMKEERLKCAKIKITIFFLLNFILLVFFWYFLICFNAVYKDRQKNLIIITCVSFGFSLIFPFFSNLFPTGFRRCGIYSSYCYGINKVFQLISW